jgi:predicted 2-oxoglutarate/Fe(II)-dependent dioxygenase YbiX/peroxiredoxin
MEQQAKVAGRVVLGERVPWFSAPLVAGGRFDLHVSAGRWVVLAFLGSAANPRAGEELAKLLNQVALFKDEHIVVGCILTERPLDADSLAAFSSDALFFIADYDGAISRSLGAQTSPRTIVLDPLLRAIADIGWDHTQGHAETVATVLRSLPTVDRSAGVPMFPPALIVPRVFSFELCDFLMQFYEQQGGQETGFQLDVDGKTSTILNARFKRRSDVWVAAPEVRAVVRQHIVRRLLPEISRFFHYQASRMDRDVVSCYDSAVGGHFFRHRDDVNVGAEHRRFAVSINLNDDYTGGDLMFPEFGHQLYRGPVGGAIVFSCGALHQVMPVTRGRRFVFLAFMYGEEDAKKRDLNNARLHPGEAPYHAGRDRLFPAAAEPEAASTAAEALAGRAGRDLAAVD